MCGPGHGASMVWLTVFLLLIGTDLIRDVSAGKKSSRKSSCAKGEFRCTNGDCVPESARCNDSKECTDGSDEMGCDFFLCKKPMWYQCKQDKSCISASFLCDKHDDCPLGDDEENCDNYEVPHVPVPCGKFEFTCTDKMCIPADLVCDGVDHCLDGSDETIGCIDIEKNCKGFLCKNKRCLKNHDWVCDGVDDCGDRSDEENCVAGCTAEHGKFECANNSTCIDLAKVCDGKEDCDDGSDEVGMCSSRECDSLKCPEKCKNTPHGAICICKPGYLFNKKTKACEDVNECDRYGLCSQGCENKPGSFNCTCVAKFKLRADGRTCELEGDAGEPFLLYTTQRAIGGLLLSSKHQYYVVKDLPQAIGVTYDGNFVYWSDIAFKTESIERSREDGSKREVLLTAGLSSPEDIAVDWYTGNIYFTDSGHMSISACTNNGKHCTVLLKDALHKPRGVALLPPNGRMYYSDWGTNASIGTAGMDGSDQKVFINDDVHWPNGLSIDWPNKRLYWVDAKLKKIESIRLDGTNRVTVLNNVLKHPFSIAVFNDRLYWSDWDTKSIQSCNKFDGKDRKTLIHDRQIFDIHIYHSSIQQKEDNPCQRTFCSHLCLLAPNGYSCGCPHGMNISENKHSCIETVKRQALLVALGNNLVKLDVQVFGRHETTVGDSFPFFIHRMAFNSINGEIFIADNHQKAIYTVDLKTKFSHKLIDEGIGNITALAFDFLGNNLYWADSDRSTIEVFSMRTHHRAIVAHFLGTDTPIGLALIPEQGKMFIALRSTSPPIHAHIDLQDMTGRGPHVHVIEEKLSGNGTFSFVVDRNKRLVYWNDMGLNQIEYTSYAGDARHFYQQNLRMPVSMAILGDALFWTAFRSKKLYWSEKSNPTLTKRVTLEKPPYGNFPDEIHLLATQPLKRFDHPCQKNNGGCSHVCVSAGQYEAACVCPTGMIFNKPTNQTCIDVLDCEFRCTSGECITISKRCNGNADCIDGSDERGCDKKADAKVTCSFREFACADGSKCIGQELRCDKHYDCPDRSDERNCEGYDSKKGCHEYQYACPNGACIDLNARCDGYADCDDGSDEKNCTAVNNEDANATVCGPDMFRCGNAQCISRWWECDGTPDCKDGSDEHDGCKQRRQFANRTTVISSSVSSTESSSSSSSSTSTVADSGKDCDTGMARCAQGRCIDERMFCDGNDDCGDNSDERNCTKDGTSEAALCPGFVEDNPTSFLCIRSGKCLPIAVRCNGTAECPNGEDETLCSNCGMNEFQCASGSCIHRMWRCDGEKDCDDASDEKDCPKTAGNSTTPSGGGGGDSGDGGRSKEIVCGANTFECEPGICIRMGAICNGVKDCANGKDEGQGCRDSCKKDTCEQLCKATPSGPVCDCRPGYVLAGNKKSCLDADECATGKPCAQLCRNTLGSYRCACYAGFMLHSDKRSCKAIGPRQYMLYNSYNQLRKLELNPSAIRILVSVNVSSIVSADVDVRRQMVYFTDEVNPVVYIYDLARNKTSVLRNLGGHPEQLAVDWITGNVYFFDARSSSIKVCSLQPRQACASIIKFAKQVHILAIAVDPTHNVLFYSLEHNWIFQVPHSVVFRCRLDGSKQTVLTNKGSHITALDCDPSAKLLYMADEAARTIHRISYDGKESFETIIKGQRKALARPISLTVFENQALILNRNSAEVGQCKLYGDYACKLFDVTIREGRQLLVVQESRQPMVKNGCDPVKTKCSHICVHAEDDGKCLCHKGEHIREGDVCPRIPASELAFDPQLENQDQDLTIVGKQEGAVEHDGAEDSDESSTGAHTALHVFLSLSLIALLAGTVWYLYKRRALNKFDIGMHFHNPELSTIDSGEVKMFANAPKLHQTGTRTELLLESPPTQGAPAPSTGGPEGNIELEDAISDSDSMKDAYDYGSDNPRQRLIM